MKPLNRWEKFFAVTAVGIYGFLIASIVVISCPGCAPGLDGARQALSTAERVQSTSIKALEQYDTDHQMAIVAAAKTQADGEKSLADYRLQRGKVVSAILDAAAVTQVGVTLIPLVELGQKKSSDLATWLTNLLAAGIKMREALAQFGVPAGGAP